jgi:flagellar motility protein MotE (MotC chaperone)
VQYENTELPKVTEDGKMSRLDALAFWGVKSMELVDLVQKLNLKVKKLNMNKFNQIKEAKSELKNIQTKLDEKKKESKEIFDAIKNRDKLAAEFVQLSKDIENKKQEISNLDSQIKDKKAELEKHTSGV